MDLLSALRLRPPPLPSTVDVDLEDEESPQMDEEEHALLRLALFMNAMAKASASGLLAGLADGVRERVTLLCQHAQRVSSSERQACLAHEFGPPPDVATRLREALLDAGPLLRREILRQLPAYQRAWVKEFDVDAGPVTPAPAAPLLAAIAERLVREATR